MQLLILADDITGAADSAARCCSAGLPAAILLEPVGPLPAGVVAVTSDSRHVAPDQAAQQVRALVAQLDAAPNAIWYKKIDSTLRGNLAAEIDAMLDVLSPDGCAVIAPAFPAQGRGLQHGRLVAPGLAAHGADLVALLRSARRPVIAVGLDVARNRVELATMFAHAAGRLLVVDALTDEDLQRVEQACVALPHAIRCGSAGFAGALARRLAPALSAPIATEPIDGAALVVIGSGSSTAHRQRLQLQAANTGDQVLHLPEPAAGAQLDGPHARRLAAALAERASERIATDDPALIVLCGGDTAIAVLGRLGVAQLAIMRELLPGMPLCRGRDRTGRERIFVLKAGNHGGDDALVELLRLARASSREAI